MRPAESPSAARFVLLALRLGIVGFGGGYAVLRRVQREVVEERRWMSDAPFLETLAVASALPGTAATNLLTMLGWRFGGLACAAGAASAFLAPSVVVMVVLGAEYDHLRSLGRLALFLDGMSAATVGVVAAVAVEMARSAVETRLALGIAIGAAVALASRSASLLEVVTVAGVLGVVLRRRRPSKARPGPDGNPEPPPPPTTPAPAAAPLLLASPAIAASTFLVFAKIGVATFGGGFAMISPIEHEVVALRGWLTEASFNDAVVLGQVTPGPVAIAATFIGFRVGGVLGALSATLGMFLPPFALAIVAARSLAAFRASATLRAFLGGVAPAVVGIIAAASFTLGRTSVHSVLAACVAAGAFALLVAFRRLTPLVPLLAGGFLAALR